jgi:hypothetical protein
MILCLSTNLRTETDRLRLMGYRNSFMTVNISMKIFKSRNFWIWLLMFSITALRIYFPNGVSMGLMFGIPLFLSTNSKILRFVIPSLAAIVIILTCFLPPRNFGVNVQICDDISMVASLMLLSYLGSLRCKRLNGKICSLADINHDLSVRINKYDQNPTGGNYAKF